MKLAFLNPAGGLKYHIRAMRFWRTEWASFRLQLETWGMEWKPKTKTCVMVGPSGGYCIPDLWLEQFDRIIAWDPDPLAETFFRRIHSNAAPRVKWVKEDWLAAVKKAEFDRAKFSETYGLPADTAFLFTNFLGQIEFLIPDSEDFLGRLTGFLRGAPFLTFHDRLSSGLKLRRESAWISETRVASDRLAQEYYLPANPNRTRFGVRKQILEVEEHDLDPFLVSLIWEVAPSFFYVPWELRPSRTQIVEGVYRN